MEPFYARRPTFFTIKDHKPNFRNNIQYWVINPSKKELGLVSKKHLEEIITNVANTIKVNWWWNTKSRFIKFDIVEFFSSISEELLNHSISFARSITTISDSVINIIHHSRKSLIFDRSAWVKKRSNSLFDVTMGS